MKTEKKTPEQLLVEALREFMALVEEGDLTRLRLNRAYALARAALTEARKSEAKHG